MKIWKIMFAGFIFFGGGIAFLASLPDEGSHKSQPSAEVPKAIAPPPRPAGWRAGDPEPVIPDLSGPSPIDSVGGPDVHSDYIPTGNRAHVSTGGYFACKDEDDLSRLKHLLAQGDGDAMRMYAVTKDCKVFQFGVVGIVEDASVWHSDTCLRPYGNPYCYWFPTSFLVRE
jgi:hypothetical protein